MVILALDVFGSGIETSANLVCKVTFLRVQRTDSAFTMNVWSFVLSVCITSRFEIECKRSRCFTTLDECSVDRESTIEMKTNYLKMGFTWRHLYLLIFRPENKDIFVMHQHDESSIFWVRHPKFWCVSFFSFIIYSIASLILCV